MIEMMNSFEQSNGCGGGKGTKSTARSRREKENQEFGELARLLPLPSAITSQLDKASIIRLTTSYLNLRNVFPHGFGTWWSGRFSPRIASNPELKEFGSHFMQVELIGNSLYDYIHQSDHPLLLDVLQGTPNESHNALIDSGLEEFEVERFFFLRMKCVLAKRNAGLTDHGYKVIHCSGYVKYKHCNTLEAGAREDGCIENLGLVGTGYTLPPTSITEIRLSPFMFMFRASLDFKIVFLDSRVSDLTGYPLNELLDKSLYELIHVSDMHELRSAHQILLDKHQATTHYYRLLCKGGGWIWLQSQLTLIHIPRASRPSCIVGVSSAVSNVEFPGSVMSPFQTPGLSDCHPIRNGSQGEEGSQTMGAYSEKFYGPNGMLLVQPPPYEAHSASTSSDPSNSSLPKSRFRKKRNPFQYKDALTGERRYCLRECSRPETEVPETGPPFYPFVQNSIPMEAQMGGIQQDLQNQQLFSAPSMYPYYTTTGDLNYLMGMSNGHVGPTPNGNGFQFIQPDSLGLYPSYPPSNILAPSLPPLDEDSHYSDPNSASDLVSMGGRDSVIIQTNLIQDTQS